MPVEKFTKIHESSQNFIFHTPLEEKKHMLKHFVVMITIFAKLAVITLGATATAPTEYGPEPGCFPGDPCDS
jgi:hypothetical protein